VSRPVVQSLILSRLDYGNATLAGIPQYLLRRLQSVMNATALLILLSSRFDHVTPLLRQYHWLKAKERINFKPYLCSYVYMGLGLHTLPMNLSRPADSQARCRLRSASSSILVVHQTCLTTVVNRSFPVSVSNVWKNLSQHVITSPSLRGFKNRLKTHLFSYFLP